MEKVYLTANDLLKTSYTMAAQIIESGFEPNFIVAIWRGGTPVGIAVQELMEYLGIHTDHIAIRTSSYVGLEQRKKVRVHNLSYLISRLEQEHKLLIIDDVFDTGKSIQAVLDMIKKKARRNTPHAIKVATPYYKPNKNLTTRKPDFYVEKTDAWLVFPHELCGLTQEEILHNKPSMQAVFARLHKHLPTPPSS